MEKSAEKIKAGDYRSTTRQRIIDIVRTCKNEGELRIRLQAKGIDPFLQRNDEGRITGVTFIDHNSRCVMNGSRLGKEFSANIFNGLFRESPINAEHTKQDAGKEQFPPSLEQFVPHHRQSDYEETAISSLLSILSPEPQENPDNQPIRRKRKKKKRRYGRQM